MTRPIQYSIFSILLGASLLLEWRSVLATWELATQNEEYTHILLIVPVVLALFFLDWRSIKLAFPAGTKLGSAILLLALLIAEASRRNYLILMPDVYLALGMFALLTWWIGSFIFCFGAKAAWKEIFPLGFLYWLVPWPQAILAVVVPWLQQESASSARTLFALSGTPVVLDGISLILPGLTLNVAPECSSIRSSLLLLLTSMIFAHLFLRSFWRKLAVVAAAIVLSPLKNGLRIFVIGFLTLRVDPSYLQGELHRNGGVVFLAIAQGIVIALLWILRRGEQHANPVQTST